MKRRLSNFSMCTKPHMKLENIPRPSLAKRSYSLFQVSPLVLELATKNSMHFIKRLAAKINLLNVILLICHLIACKTFTIISSSLVFSNRFYSWVSSMQNNIKNSQRLMSRWKYQFSYDHWSQASWAQPVFIWVTPFWRVVSAAVYSLGPVSLMCDCS